MVWSLNNSSDHFCISMVTWDFRGLSWKFSSAEHQTARVCVKLKSLRARAWMIYAFVISHLLKQGVNFFVPLHQSSPQSRRDKHGANVLEENSKVNLAICWCSSISLWNCTVVVSDHVTYLVICPSMIWFHNGYLCIVKKIVLCLNRKLLRF